MTVIKYYVIPGDPIALARVKYGRGKFYDSQKHTKLLTGIYIRNHHEDARFFEGPVFMDIIFHLPIPKGVQDKERLMHQYHFFKPDTSNLLKFIEDVAESICYHNDCIISKINVEKVYSVNPRTEFTLSEIVDRRLERKLCVV